MGSKVNNGMDIRLENLREIFSRYGEIQAVYLFGSMATGKARKDSDIDLAVVASGPEPRKRQLDILSDLARAGFCKVDLVFLDTDDVVLKFEAVHANKLVYCAEGFDRGEYFSKVVRAYFDFLPLLEVQRDAYKRRILNGQIRADF